MHTRNNKIASTEDLKLGSRHFEIADGRTAVSIFGPARLAQKISSITIREPNSAVEVIDTVFGKQEAHQGTHYVAKDAHGEYPYEVEAFHANMRELDDRKGHYQKITPSQLIEIPKGVTVRCVTIDQGKQKPILIEYPDFIGIGVKDEVYPVSRAEFEGSFILLQ